MLILARSLVTCERRISRCSAESLWLLQNKGKKSSVLFNLLNWATVTDLQYYVVNEKNWLANRHIVMKIFSIVASSVASERFLSTAGSIRLKVENSFNLNAVKKLMLVGSKLKPSYKYAAHTKFNMSCDSSSKESKWALCWPARLKRHGFIAENIDIIEWKTETQSRNHRRLVLTSTCCDIRLSARNIFLQIYKKSTAIRFAPQFSTDLHKYKSIYLTVWR